MKEQVYIVKGICRHFSGDCKIYIVGVRRNEADARRLGFEWGLEKNQQFKAEGRNIHASYELVQKTLI